MHRSRLWLAAATSTAGVVVGWHEPPLPPLLLVGAVGAIAVPLRHGLVRLTALLAIAFAVGSIVAVSHAQRGDEVEDAATRYERCELAGVIVQRTSLGTLIRTEEILCPDRSLRAGAEVVVFDANGELGSRFGAVGWLIPLGRDGADAARRRAGAAARFDVMTSRTGEPRGVLYRAAAAIRRSLRKATADQAPVTAGLLRGLAIGETDRIPMGAQDSLRRAGLSHLVAVSGTNVTIVLAVVAAVAGRSSRRARLVSCAGALVLFVTVVGPEPSVMRAAAMGAVGLAALGAGSRSSPMEGLAVAVIVVLVLRPQMVHSVGLHLSVAATAGICLWAGALQNAIRFGPRWLRAACAVTVSAQVAVAPLLISTFGEISITGVPANLLAAPAVGPATILALAAGIVGLVWAEGARWLVAIAGPLADWIALVGSALGGPSASVPLAPGVGLAAAALVLGLVTLTVRPGGPTRPLAHSLLLS